MLESLISSFFNKITDLMENEERLDIINLNFTSILDVSTLLSHDQTQMWSHMSSAISS